MKARITGEVAKAPSVTKMTVEEVKEQDPKCRRCKSNFGFCEAGCEAFWRRNEKKLLSRTARRRSK